MTQSESSIHIKRSAQADRAQRRFNPDPPWNNDLEDWEETAGGGRTGSEDGMDSYTSVTEIVLKCVIIFV